MFEVARGDVSDDRNAIFSMLMESHNQMNSHSQKSHTHSKKSKSKSTTHKSKSQQNLLQQTQIQTQTQMQMQMQTNNNNPSMFEKQNKKDVFDMFEQMRNDTPKFCFVLCFFSVFVFFNLILKH